jgi:hypothetical protein
VTRRQLVLAAAGLGGDPGILSRLIALEDGAALANRLGRGEFAVHEDEHARALRTELAAFTIDGPPPPTEAAQLSGAARRLAEGRRGAAAELERELVAAYLEAVPKLREPNIVRTAATILASHAQHEALLTS